MARIGGLGPGELGLSLLVQDVAAASAFYRDVPGAEGFDRTALSEPMRGLPAGTVTTVEMRIGNMHLSVVRENPGWPEAPRPDWPRSPHSAGTTTVLFSIYVEDVDAAVERALAAGAKPRSRATIIAAASNSARR